MLLAAVAILGEHPALSDLEECLVFCRWRKMKL